MGLFESDHNLNSAIGTRLKRGVMEYFCRVEKDEDAFMASFPDYPGVFSDGRTFEEALENGRSALNEVIGVSLKQGKAVPVAVDRSGEQGLSAVSVDIEKEVALTLRALRGSQTQTEIANRVSMPYQNYQRLERSVSGNISIKTLQRVASAFGKKVEIVFH
jgi:predicted RNase H-like HicB family nuclease